MTIESSHPWGVMFHFNDQNKLVGVMTTVQDVDSPLIEEKESEENYQKQAVQYIAQNALKIPKKIKIVEDFRHESEYIEREQKGQLFGKFLKTTNYKDSDVYVVVSDNMKKEEADFVIKPHREIEKKEKKSFGEKVLKWFEHKKETYLGDIYEFTGKYDIEKLKSLSNRQKTILLREKDIVNDYAQHGNNQDGR